MSKELLEERKLRSLIRKAIKLRKSQLTENNLLKSDEDKLRQVIRRMLAEGSDIDADTEPAPYESTALSALADAFNQILPVLKTGLRKLRKPEERRSYRAHILQKFKSMFDNFEGLDAQQAMGEGDLTEQEKDVKIKIDNRPDDAMIVPDIEKERFKPEEEPELEPDDADVDQLAISTEDPTGARFAFSTINNSNIEKLLGDKRKLLPSDEYKEEYKNYALYNVDLWLLTYEKELADELGTEPAFTDVVTPKPEGAQVSARAAAQDTPDLPDIDDIEIPEPEQQAV